MKLPISTFGGLNQSDQEENLINKAYQAGGDGLSQRAPLEAADMINIDFTQGGIRKRRGSAEYQDFTAGDLNILVADDVLISGTKWVDPATGSEIEVIVSKKTIYTNQSGIFAQINNAGGSAYAHNSDVAKVTFAQTDGHLFIGIDGAGNYVQVYRSGAALDEAMYHSSNHSYIDQDSASGATNLYVDDETKFSVGERILIAEGYASEESNYIESISTGVLVTATNLTNTHLAQSWTARTPTVAKNENLRDVTHGGGIFVAVGDSDGTNPFILTSTAGTTWVTRTPAVAKDENLYGVAYGDGLFVAVGTRDGTNPYILTSPDGTTWTARTPTVAKDEDLNSVAYGNSLFVAVGTSDGDKPYIITSPDGTTWTERTPPSPVPTNLQDVTYGGDYFIAVGETLGQYPLILRSTDGSIWEQIIPQENKEGETLFTVVYSSNDELYVAAGSSDGTNPYMLKSADSAVWTEITPVDAKDEAVYKISYSGEMYVGVGSSDGTNPYMLISKNGLIWDDVSPAVAKDEVLSGVTFGEDLFVAVGTADGTNPYILTAAEAIYVRPANRYTEAYDTATTHDITGSWDAATYIIESFQTRLLLSTGNTLVNYTPEAYTSGSGIWDRAGSTAGFLSAAGNVRSISAYAPLMSDSIQEALYIGTDVGFDVTTGFSIDDRLIRIEGARSPINHQSVAKALNWLVYLTDDKNIMAINKANVIDVGRRFKNFEGTGHLDILDVSNSSVGAYGFYDKGKKQVIFSYSDSTGSPTNFNEHMAVIDFALGEPVPGEAQPSYEQRVRCLYWFIDSTADDWFSGIYQKTGSTIGIFQTGYLYTRETTNLDLGANNIDTTWELPTFTGAATDRVKQWYWLNGKMQSQASGTPQLTVAFRLDRVGSNTGTGTWSLLDTAVKQISNNLELYRQSEAIKIIITSTDVYEWVIYNLTLKFDIGAELIT